jgi:hypothetical protein
MTTMPVVPTRSSSLARNHVPALRHAATVSTFGDSSVTSDDYPPVQSNPCTVRVTRGRMPNIDPAVQRPPNRTYAPQETTIALTAFQMGFSTGNPCTLLVDSTRRIVPPTNNPGLPRPRLFGLRARNTPVTAIAKATYAISLRA